MKTKIFPKQTTKKQTSMPIISEKQREYVRKIKRNHRQIRVYQILILLIFILLWEFAARMGFINDFIFCSPSKLCSTFITMVTDGSLLYHIGITLYETLIGFVIVIAFIATQMKNLQTSQKILKNTQFKDIKVLVKWTMTN